MVVACVVVMCGGVYGSGVGGLPSIIGYSVCFKRLEMPCLLFCLVTLISS